MNKCVVILLEEMVENICDNFCKYRETCDENAECEYMRNNEGKCPLDVVNSYYHESNIGNKEGDDGK